MSTNIRYTPMNHSGLTTSLTACQVHVQSNIVDTTIPITIHTPRSTNVGTASRLRRTPTSVQIDCPRSRAFCHERRWP
jgi:hypothetical protein